MYKHRGKRTAARRVAETLTGESGLLLCFVRAIRHAKYSKQRSMTPCHTAHFFILRREIDRDQELKETRGTLGQGVFFMSFKLSLALKISGFSLAVSFL